MERAVLRLLCCGAAGALWAVLATARVEAMDLVIVEDGRPKAAIVVAANADEKVKLAAEELQTYLEKISGAKLPIATDAAEAQGAAILVGPSKPAAAMGVAIPSGLTTARREEGFVIACKGDRLLLAGNSEGPYHGTEYAVYDFLRSLGVRWFMPGDFGEIVPQLKTIRVPEQEVRQKPDFVMRNWWLHATKELVPLETRWKLRNKMNPDAMFATPGDSSVRAVCAPKDLVKEKPELFALNENGSRNPFLPNLTNPEAVKVAADVIKAHFRKDPKANSFGFAPDDGLPRDFNPETVKLNQGFPELGGRPGVPGEASVSLEWFTFVNRVAADVIKAHFRKDPKANSFGFAPDDGFPRDFNPETVKLNQGFTELGGRPGVPGEASISLEWFTFVNRVAAEVHKEFPDAFLATNGYANRDIAPQGVALDDHIVLMFAAIWCCQLHAYDDAHCWQKSRQGQMLKRWCELCKDVWIYGYNYQMLVSGLTPLPEFTKLRRDFPLMKQWGVMGFLDESRNVWAEAGIASRYLRAQLEWNANADVDALLDEFFALWYGKAAGPMKAFYFALDDAITKTPMHGHEDRILPEVYTPALLGELQKDVAEAQRLADTERTRLHVRADALICDHLAAYMGLAAAEAHGNFPEIVQQADRMLALRKELHAISPFFIWPDEKGYHTGVWYWTITNRRDYYQALADKTTGKAGDLVAVAPEQAAFRTDPHDDGVFAAWYAPTLDEAGWKPILTTKAFYRQGYDDAAGHPYVGAVWYRLKVDVPETVQGKKVMLCAPVVVDEAWLWVNGKYIVHRPYQESYIRPAALEADVTAAIEPGRPNVIAIRVDTSLAPAQAAEGLQCRCVLYTPK